MIPRELKAKMLREAQARFRSLNEHAVFLLSEGSVNLESQS